MRQAIAANNTVARSKRKILPNCRASNWQPFDGLLQCHRRNQRQQHPFNGFNTLGRIDFDGPNEIHFNRSWPINFSVARTINIHRCTPYCHLRDALRHTAASRNAQLRRPHDRVRLHRVPQILFGVIRTTIPGRSHQPIPMALAHAIERLSNVPSQYAIGIAIIVVEEAIPPLSSAGDNDCGNEQCGLRAIRRANPTNRVTRRASPKSASLNASCAQSVVSSSTNEHCSYY